jgi:helix-turn-helix protein
LAGGSTRDRAIGVGPALRKARLVRGVTLQEAARDTRLRAEQLDALEREEFEALPGEVYVRGLLRTYSGYLGVDPDKVLSAYGKHARDPEPPPPPSKVGGIERALAATRIRDNQRLLLVAAVTLLVVLVAVGIVDRRSSAPPPADVPASASQPVAPGIGLVDVALVGVRDTDARVVVDGVVQVFTLQAGEKRSFQGERVVSLYLQDASAAQVTVDGSRADTRAAGRVPWCVTYEAGASPRPGVCE